MKNYTPPGRYDGNGIGKQAAKEAAAAVATRTAGCLGTRAGDVADFATAVALRSGVAAVERAEVTAAAGGVHVFWAFPGLNGPSVKER